MRYVFSRLHPAVELLFFVLVLGFPMFYLHPALLAASLPCAVGCVVTLYPARTVRRGAAAFVPVVLLAAVLNPAFNHKGVTILAYLPSGNPLTLESLLYGLAAAVLLAVVLVWSACYAAVMTSDKFLYLFGRVLPALSLVLSMALRFVPRFVRQMGTIRTAQRGLGGTERGLRSRLRARVAALSALIGWALEHAVETADAMRARGYGLPGRTAYALYRLDGRDRAVLVWLAACGLYLACGAAAGALSWRWYPMLGGPAASPLAVSFPLVYLLLCAGPLILERREVRLWRRSRSVL